MATFARVWYPVRVAKLPKCHTEALEQSPHLLPLITKSHPAPAKLPFSGKRY